MNQTALYDLHVSLSAKMVDFAGWEMPVMYTGIIEEHQATRNGCTLFDVSHMGRLYLAGSDATALLEYLCTRNIGDMQPGQCRYSHICKEDGGILDDVIVSRLENAWLVVCNASNRSKIVQWIQHHATGKNVKLDDQTMASVMVAIQGPEIHQLAKELLPIDLSDIKRYRLKAGRYMGIEYICSRTGYTGEDGFEFILQAAAGRMFASSVLDSNGPAKGRIKAAGLGARDTLRLEAGMPLYGHELSENVDPLTTGQSWCVNLDKNFIGADTLRRLNKEGLKRRLVGLEIEGKRIARQDTPLLYQDKLVGIVTSGTMSPTLGKVIAMGLVDSAVHSAGTLLQADIRGQKTQAKIIPLPFYKR